MEFQLVAVAYASVEAAASWWAASRISVPSPISASVEAVASCTVFVLKNVLRSTLRWKTEFGTGFQTEFRTVV